MIVVCKSCGQVYLNIVEPPKNGWRTCLTCKKLSEVEVIYDKYERENNRVRLTSQGARSSPQNSSPD